jgi:hypothetical protein
MAYISGEQWSERQADVWGSKDPEVFGRVVERVQQQEREVVREVERMVAERVSAHAIVHYITNSILRGVDTVVHEPPEGVEMTDGDGRVWDRFAKRWVDKGPKTSPAINPNPTGA